MADDLQGRTFLVTGANSGHRPRHGRGAGRARRAAWCWPRGRRSGRGRCSTASARRDPSAAVEFLQVDVSDLASVRRAAAAFLATGRPLDVLVNNAGVGRHGGAQRRRIRSDLRDQPHRPVPAHEPAAPPAIERAPQGRIVNVSSVGAHAVKRIDWSLLERRTAPRRSGFVDYAVTKLMNILHAKELARRLAGTRVTTYALHPGGVASNIWRALPAAGAVGHQAVPDLQRRGREDASSTAPPRPSWRRRPAATTTSAARCRLQSAGGGSRLGRGAVGPDRGGCGLTMRTALSGRGGIGHAMVQAAGLNSVASPAVEVVATGHAGLRRTNYVYIHMSTCWRQP